MSISDDLLFIRKELNKLGASVRENLVKALDRVEASFHRHQDALLEVDGGIGHLTQGDFEALKERSEVREEPRALGQCISCKGEVLSSEFRAEAPDGSDRFMCQKCCQEACEKANAASAEAAKKRSE